MLATDLTTKDLSDLEQLALARSKSDWSLFGELYFADLLDDWQSAALKDMGDGKDVAIRACNGAGKARVAAIAVNAFLQTRPGTRICVTMSASGRQVRAQLWGEIRSLRQKSLYPLDGETLMTEIHLGPKEYAIGFSTDDPANIEGFHADNILVVLDEAKSLERDTFDAVDRLRSVGTSVQMLVVSTTGSRTSPFAECFTKLRSRFSCYHVPGVTRPGTPYVARRIRSDWLSEMREKLRDSDPLYLSMVLAEFYDESQTVCVPLAWIESACARELKPFTGEPSSMGVDVARSEAGDETVIAVLDGGALVELIPFHTRDTMAICGQIIQTARQHQVEPSAVAVDDGGVGGGVVDRLREQRFGVQAVQFGSSANEPQFFVNRAAELWWNMRERFERGTVSVPRDYALMAQLSTRNFDPPDSRGRKKLESKESLSNRNLPSPDRAEALALAFAARAEQPSLRAVRFSQDTKSDDRVRDIIRRAQQQSETMR